MAKSLKCQSLQIDRNLENVNVYLLYDPDYLFFKLAELNFVFQFEVSYHPYQTCTRDLVIAFLKILESSFRERMRYFHWQFVCVASMQLFVKSEVFLLEILVLSDFPFFFPLGKVI